MKPKILLAVDATQTSRKAIAHVGEVLHASQEGEIVIFHKEQCPPRLAEKGHIGEERGAEALMEKLDEVGFDDVAYPELHSAVEI